MEREETSALIKNRIEEFDNHWILQQGVAEAIAELEKRKND